MTYYPLLSLLAWLIYAPNVVALAAAVPTQNRAQQAPYYFNILVGQRPAHVSDTNLSQWVRHEVDLYCMDVIAKYCALELFNRLLLGRSVNHRQLMKAAAVHALPFSRILNWALPRCNQGTHPIIKRCQDLCRRICNNITRQGIIYTLKG